MSYNNNNQLRNMNTNKIIEITLSKILEETELTQHQFIDLCIMLGSDYCPTINGIGMTRAYSLIKKYESNRFIFGCFTAVLLLHFLQRKLS